MSTQLSSPTWPIRSVQVQLGTVAHPKSEPPLRAASGSQEDPEHRRANLDPPRTTPLTMETLAAHGEDSLQRLCRRVEASIARSACLASSSTVLGGGPEEQEDLRRRMDEFMLHEEYHKSTLGEDGEIPLDALRSPPRTEMRSFLYSGPSTDMADTVSLPRRPRVHEHPRAWHPDLPITSMAPKKSLDPLRPEPTYGALDRTAELLALAAHGEDSLQRLCRRVEASIARSACLASSSTVLGGGPEEQEDLRRRMDEFMLHEEYHKSTLGEDGEIPLDALRSPPRTEMRSFLYSGPSTDMADTVSLPRRPRVHEHPRAWHPDLPITSMAPEKSLDPLRPGACSVSLLFYPKTITLRHCGPI